MKKIISILILVFTVITTVSANDNIQVISQSDNSITVRRTYTETARYAKIDGNLANRRSAFYKPGNIGLAAHISYGFKYNMEIGGQLYYNFPSNSYTKFGVAVGFDYGVRQWWQYKEGSSYYNPYYTDGKFNGKMAYWDIRAGIIICKYLGIGGIYGKYTDQSGDVYNDGGIYGTIYLPFCQWFGLNLDAKWTKQQGATVGAGIIIQMNTKL